MALFKKSETSRLAAIRETFIDYKVNPRNYMDMDKPAYEDDDTITYKRKPLGKVLGLETLGEGYYSRAFAFSESKVLKITNVQDRGYESFVDFIRVVGHKFSAFPKIYMVTEWEGQRVYLIERMETISEENEKEREFLSSYCREYLSGWGNEPDMKRNRFLNLPEDFDAGIAALKKWYRESQNRGLDISYDVHSHNVMVRPNGQPVIIDPFS